MSVGATEIYGMKRKPEADSEYVHTWETTTDPEDMILPEATFVAFPTDVVNDVTIREILKKRYPDTGGVERVVVRRKDYSRDWYAETYPLPTYALKSNYDNIVTSILELSLRVKGPFVIRSNDADRVIRRAYKESTYTTAPLVLKRVHKQLILATPSPTASKVRTGRRAGAARRAEKKRETQKVEEAKSQERYQKRERVRAYHHAAKTAVERILDRIPAITTCVRLGYIHQPQDVDEKDQDRDRHWLFAFKSTTDLYRRLTRGSLSWDEFPVVATLADKFTAAGDLVGDPDFDKIHADDLEAVTWFRKVAKRVLKAVAVKAATVTVGAAPVSTPV